MSYGSNFLQGTQGDTFAAGWRTASGIVDGGSMVKGGGLSSESPITKSFTLAEIADDFGQSFGSKIVSQDGTTDDLVGVTEANSAGTLAYQAGPTEWIMRGGNVTNTIGGVSNDILVSAASNRNGAVITDYINELESTRRIEVSGINVYAKPDGTINPILTRSDNAGALISFGTDGVADETRAVPGELTYRWGQMPVPYSDVYKAKDSFEV